MRYLLDTCVVSDFVKGEPNTLKRLKAIAPSQIAISSITAMELRYGLVTQQIEEIWAKREGALRPLFFVD